MSWRQKMRQNRSQHGCLYVDQQKARLNKLQVVTSSTVIVHFNTSPKYRFKEAKSHHRSRLYLSPIYWLAQFNGERKRGNMFLRPV
ncbi:MAG: hypothetical protein R3A45_06610 [Bdellovibrionota bacterium]